MIRKLLQSLLTICLILFCVATYGYYQICHGCHLTLDSTYIIPVDCVQESTNTIKMYFPYECIGDSSCPNCHWHFRCEVDKWDTFFWVSLATGCFDGVASCKATPTGSYIELDVSVPTGSIGSQGSYRCIAYMYSDNCAGGDNYLITSQTFGYSIDAPFNHYNPGCF